MAVSLISRKRVGCWFLTIAAPLLVFGQTHFVPQGGEYAVAGILPGDQVWPVAALAPSGGYVVWQDNITDGSGAGISARRLDSSFSGSLAAFRVNQSAADGQERPQVALLKDGGAVFVWQSGPRGQQDIFARFLSAAGTWAPTGEIRVNTYTSEFQVNPSVAVLADGTVVVVWGSYGQESGTEAFQGVFAQRFDATGQKLENEFQVNLTATYNQRSPSVAALSGGGFVVVWASEQQRQENSVDIYARRFNAAGSPVSGESLVNTLPNICASPRVVGAADGSFLVVWQERDLANRADGWDIWARRFGADGVGGTGYRLNSHTFGDQFLPTVACAGNDYFAIWSSLGQDGAREGVFGRLIADTGMPQGDEFGVNRRTASQQLHPALASDGAGRFLALWTTFGGGLNSFDLAALRYVSGQAPLPTPAAPLVTVLSSNALAVSWPRLAGFDVDHYKVYADGAATPIASLPNNHWRLTDLPPGSTHTFRLGYVLADGRHSPLSPASAPKTTYGTLTYGGIPYDWMADEWGGDIFAWPSPNADSDADGASNRDEFLAGTNPRDAASVLKQRLQTTPQGIFLHWNTEPGLIYQVQAATEFGQWRNLGEPRFAAGAVDSLYVGGGDVGYFRVIRLR